MQWSRPIKSNLSDTFSLGPEQHRAFDCIKSWLVSTKAIACCCTVPLLLPASRSFQMQTLSDSALWWSKSKMMVSCVVSHQASLSFLWASSDRTGVSRSSVHFKQCLFALVTDYKLIQAIYAPSSIWVHWMLCASPIVLWLQCLLLLLYSWAKIEDTYLTFSPVHLSLSPKLTVRTRILNVLQMPRPKEVLPVYCSTPTQSLESFQLSCCSPGSIGESCLLSSELTSAQNNGPMWLLQKPGLPKQAE